MLGLRASAESLGFLVVVSLVACVPETHPNPDWMKPPKSFQPKTAELTFNEANLKAFVMTDTSAQDARVEELKATPGSFKGQAIFKSGAGLGEAMPHAQYGDWELSASLEEPIVFDIIADYSIITTREVGKPIAPHKAIEFTGTLVEFDFQREDKPRKLTFTVKADEVKVLED